MQDALNMTWNYALGMFEQGPHETLLKDSGIFPGEAELQKTWLQAITPHLEKASLIIPDTRTWAPVDGGRKGYHTDHLAPLVEEMGEVFRVDPAAEW
jgi:ring-1,2-phenylacetyl-CoA epoxidase subunit PaaC